MKDGAGKGVLMQENEAIFFGLDIGRAQDYSALSIISRRWYSSAAQDIDPNRMVSRYFVMYMRRFELNTPYEIVENEVARLWQMPEMMGSRNWALGDMTGVGAPVMEAIRKKKVPMIGIVITGGETISQPQPNEYHVPKEALVTQLVKLAQTGRLKVMKGVKYQQDFREELGAFGYKINKASSTVSYESIENAVHDDLVISVALATWFAESHAPAASRGGQSYHSEDYKGYNPYGRRTG
jgi:hypothetical protein